MIKKFFDSFLAVAAIAVTVGMVSSCKDYDDEIYSDLHGQIVDQNASLTELINTQIGNLRTEMLEKLNTQKAECNAEHERLEKLLNDFVAEAGEKYATKKELAAALDALNDKFASKAELQAAIDALKDKYVTIDALQALKAEFATKTELQAAIDAVKAEYDAKIAELVGKLEQCVNDLAAAKAKITEIEGKIANINNAIEKAESTLVSHGNSIDSLVNALSNLNWVNEEKEEILAWGPRLAAVADSVSTAYDMAEANANKIVEIENLIDSLHSNTTVRLDSLAKVTTALKAEIESVRELANANLTKAKAYTDAAVSATAKTLSGELASEISNLKAYIDEKVKELEAGLGDVKDDLEDLEGELGGVKGEVSALTVRLSDLEEAYKLADAALEERIEALETKVAELEPRIAKNEEDIKNLTERVDKIEENMSKQITSIVLQGAYSPVIGYFAMPNGTQSNVLATYYGSPANGEVYFPTTSTKYYRDSDHAFTEQEADFLGLYDGVEQTYDKEFFVEETENNAGTLYFTVNPNTVDLTGTTFELVNSLEEPASVTLAAPTASDFKLTFGYTRATANGFYEAKAMMEEKDVENARVKFEMDGFVDMAKGMLDSKSLNLTDIATTLYNQFNEIADANAVKATWTDADGVAHSVYSNYGIAAVSVKPLSFSFLGDIKIDNFPGIGKIKNVINSAVDKVNLTLPDMSGLDIEVPTIKNIDIELTDETLAKFKVTISDVVKVDGKDVEIELDGMYIELDGQKHYLKSDNKVTVSVEGQEVQVSYTVDLSDAVKELIGEVEGTVNDQFDQLSKFMDDVNDMLDELNKINDLNASIDDAKDKVKDELNGFLTSLNNKLTGVINSINDKLQPAMLISTTDGLGVLSQAKNYPSKFSSAITLVPTTYTAELLAPTYQKFVAVTDVIKDGASAKGGDANCLSVLKQTNSSNENLCVILPGSTRTVDFNGTSGYVYEVTYSAMDYFGYTENVKYYIQID